MQRQKNHIHSHACHDMCDTGSLWAPTFVQTQTFPTFVWPPPNIKGTLHRFFCMNSPMILYGICFFFCWECKAVGGQREQEEKMTKTHSLCIVTNFRRWSLLSSLVPWRGRWGGGGGTEPPSAIGTSPRAGRTMEQPARRLIGGLLCPSAPAAGSPLLLQGPTPSPAAQRVQIASGGGLMAEITIFSACSKYSSPHPLWSTTW